MELNKAKLGKDLKDEFNLNSSVYFTNHGSYGATPKKILDKKFQLELEMENVPDKWFRFSSLDYWNKSKTLN
jgi:hypothetical protein